MTTVTQARSYLRRHPDEAMADLLGLTLMCALIVAGFSLPGLL